VVGSASCRFRVIHWTAFNLDSAVAVGQRIHKPRMHTDKHGFRGGHFIHPPGERSWFCKSEESASPTRNSKAATLKAASIFFPLFWTCSPCAGCFRRLQPVAFSPAYPSPRPPFRQPSPILPPVGKRPASGFGPPAVAPAPAETCQTKISGNHDATTCPQTPGNAARRNQRRPGCGPFKRRKKVG